MRREGPGPAAAKDALAGWELQRTDGGESDRRLFDVRRADGAHVSVEVSPPGDGPCACRTPAGNVSYRTFTGVTSADAFEVTRAFAQRLQAGGIALEASPAAAAPPPPTEARVDLAVHRFALEASGFTVVPSIVDRAHLDELRHLADLALAETQRQVARGASIPEESIEHDFHPVARGLYLWGDAALRLVENATVRALCDELIGPHKLIDMIHFVCMPTPELEDALVEGWHRDVFTELGGDYRPRYLWFMLPLDDFAADNGSTWIVPGSHRLPEPPFRDPGAGLHRYASRVQMLVKAGDAFVLDPMTLHSRGRNVSQRPRRLLNMMLCHVDAPIHWQWDYAGKRIRDTASPRLRSLLGGHLSEEARAAFAAKSPPTTQLERDHVSRNAAWPALPPGWQP